jgi:peptide/nickel transport system ATP-binding protein
MIQIRGLTISFAGQAAVVDRLDLDIETGRTTVVIGESGSGKSVTIAAILGILPNEASVAGSITLDGVELLSLPDRDMNRLRGKALGYVPQGGGNSMHPLLRVGAQIAEPVIFHQKKPKKEAVRIAAEWLEKVGLTPSDKMSRAYPHALSGGMRQRALIAMGAAGGADTLLADEPTKGLDHRRIAQLSDLFRSLHGKTILCVTHDLRFAQSVADNLCVMYGGEAVEYSDAESFFKEPLHPYSRMLLASLPENGMECPDVFTPPIDEKAGCLFSHRCPYKKSDCLREIQMFSAGNHHVRCCLYADHS